MQQQTSKRQSLLGSQALTAESGPPYYHPRGEVAWPHNKQRRHQRNGLLREMPSPSSGQSGDSDIAREDLTAILRKLPYRPMPAGLVAELK